ncbi:hypothetical protein CBL_09645 [Carabus blaptoides fortunei]
MAFEFAKQRYQVYNVSLERMFHVTRALGKLYDYDEEDMDLLFDFNRMLESNKNSIQFDYRRFINILLNVLIYNPRDYPDTSSGGLVESLIPLQREVFLQIDSVTVEAVQMLKEYPRDVRGCVFSTEDTTSFDTSYYSYSDCLNDCKMRSILALCECIPFYMSISKKLPFIHTVHSALIRASLSSRDSRDMNEVNVSNFIDMTYLNNKPGDVLTLHQLMDETELHVLSVKNIRKHLVKLKIASISLRTVPVFGNVIPLDTIEIDGNKIKTLPTNGFSVPNPLYIHLYNNEIEIIEIGAFNRGLWIREHNVTREYVEISKDEPVCAVDLTSTSVCLPQVNDELQQIYASGLTPLYDCYATSCGVCETLPLDLPSAEQLRQATGAIPKRIDNNKVTSAGKTSVTTVRELQPKFRPPYVAEDGPVTPPSCAMRDHASVGNHQTTARMHQQMMDDRTGLNQTGNRSRPMPQPMYDSQFIPQWDNSRRLPTKGSAFTWGQAVLRPDDSVETVCSKFVERFWSRDQQIDARLKLERPFLCGVEHGAVFGPDVPGGARFERPHVKFSTQKPRERVAVLDEEETEDARMVAGNGNPRVDWIRQRGGRTHKGIQRSSHPPTDGVRISGAFKAKPKRITHQALISFQAAGQAFHHVFLLVPELTYAIVLGTDWLRRVEAVVDLGHRCLTVETQTGRVRIPQATYTHQPTSSEYLVLFISSTWMPAGSIALCTLVKQGCDEHKFNEVLDDSNVTDSLRERLDTLLRQNKQVFSEKPGRVAEFEHCIEVMDDSPFQQKAYPIPVAHREARVTEDSERGSFHTSHLKRYQTDGV